MTIKEMQRGQQKWKC